MTTSTVRMQDDVDGYINSEWKSNNPIPDIYPRYTNFTALSENLEKQKIEICENKENVIINNLFNLYKGQSSEQTNNYIKKKVNVINDCESKQELINHIISLIPKGKYLLFHVCHSGTERNPLFQVPQFTFGGLSLPDKSYYTDRKELKDDLLELIKNQLSIFDINGDVNFIWEVESKLAEYHYSRSEKREPLKTYHPTTMYQLKQQMSPFFDKVSDYLPDEYHDIVLNNHKILEGFKELLTNISLEQLKILMSWKLIRSYASYTTNSIYDNNFAFFNTKLNGIKTAKSLTKRAAAFVEGFLEDEFSQIYLNKYADPSLKDSFVPFVERIRDTLYKKMEKANWMCQSTREKALDKLKDMTLKVVAPNVFRKYNEIESYSSWLEFVDNYYKWDWDVLEVKEKMYKMRDPETWEMSAMTVNAYYHPLYNEIVFPAGILQEPFYSTSQSYGANAGGIGAVIAHEMTHGFDDQGSRFDKNGYLYDWWSKSTRETYENTIKKMEEHFNSLIHEDLPVNGKLTLGENLADLGGMQTAISSCESDEEKKKCIKSWAVVWRANVRREYAREMIALDPHSPPRLRINAILQHIEEFYRLFDVKENDGMFISLDKRCDLWNEKI